LGANPGILRAGFGSIPIDGSISYKEARRFGGAVATAGYMWHLTRKLVEVPLASIEVAAIVEACTPEESASFTTVPENDRLPRLVDDNLS
jgi:hypothetical protein